MESDSTLAEIARLLSPEGVFTAYDQDFYPGLPEWEAELALFRLDRCSPMCGIIRNMKEDVPSSPCPYGQR